MQQQERELLQHSLSALYASMGAKEQELARAHAGRRRLRAALAEQRDCSDAQIGELQRQMLQVGLGARLGLQHLALALTLSLTYP